MTSWELAVIGLFSVELRMWSLHWESKVPIIIMRNRYFLNGDWMELQIGKSCRIIQSECCGHCRSWILLYWVFCLLFIKEYFCYSTSIDDYKIDYSVMEAIRSANFVASISVSRYGAQKSYPTIHEIEEYEKSKNNWVCSIWWLWMILHMKYYITAFYLVHISISLKYLIDLIMIIIYFVYTLITDYY